MENNKIPEETFLFEAYLNETLLKMWFNPEKSDFDQLKADMEPVLIDTLMTQIYAKLTPEQNEEVWRLFDAGKEDEAMIYIEKIIPDYEDFVADIFEKFQQDRIHDMN